MATNKTMKIGDGTNTTVDFEVNGSIKTDKFKAPTTSGGSTYGVGSNGQVLKSNGTTSYWGAEKDTVTTVTTTGSGNAITSMSASNGVITATKGATYSLSNHTHNTSSLTLPSYREGTADIAIRPLINDNRANRLAFLPADQIIIEQTTDGGTTWVDAGVPNGTKLGLFSQTRPAINIPLNASGVKDVNCGIRITFTAMKYNVPEGTAETEKYNYWNSQYIKSTERYCQLYGFYFWVNSNSDKISVKAERATGANSTSWTTIFDSDSNSWGGISGWSGNDWITISQSTFGGGTNQTGNFWNYRLTFFTRPSVFGSTLATTYTTTKQQIMEIRGYGDTWWTSANSMMSRDHLYSWDSNQNATFPSSITASSGSFTGNVSAANIKSKGDSETPVYFDANGIATPITKRAALNSWINSLETGNATPSDNDYYVSQFVGGGTTTTTFHRRPVSALWEYIKSKISTVLGLDATNYGGKAATAGDAEKVNGKTVGVDVPANAEFTDTQSDWNATSGKAQILNKPTIPSAVTESTVSGWGFTKNTGTYSKPSGGIPKTDLAQAIQNSLSLADSALQELPAASTTVAGVTTIGVSGGAAYYTHTHNYAGSTSAGGAANSVKTSITFYKDSTSLGTFNGSTALSVTFKPMTTAEINAMF